MLEILLEDSGPYHIEGSQLILISYALSLTQLALSTHQLKLQNRQVPSTIYVVPKNYQPVCVNKSKHRDHCIQIERANMHYHDITCTRTFDTGLTSAEGQKPDCFK
jgi:hypothetical protein